MPSPSSIRKDEVSQPQRERLHFIDFRLYFLGTVNRNDMVARFGLKESAASRDLALYKELAPKNLDYDLTLKTYTPSDDFKPLFDHSESQALLALLHGIGDDFVGPEGSMLTAESPTQVNFPNVDLLAQVTRAIHRKTAIKIHYLSLSSGPSEREFCPYALVNTGLRWHVRGFDRKEQRFSDFVINRIEKVKRFRHNEIQDHESKSADVDWNEECELHLVPHPAMAYPKTIETEYHMIQGKLVIKTRRALAGYVLRLWNVDCSNDHNLSGPDVHLWLENASQLRPSSNLVIAPGFSPSIPFTENPS